MKPLSFLRSIPYFFIPALIFFISIYFITPLLVNLKISGEWIYLITLGLPMAVLLVASLVGHIKEGGNLSSSSLRERLRYKEFDKKKILYTIGLVLFLIICGGILGITAKILADAFPSLLPQYLPLPTDPHNPGNIPKALLGTPLASNYVFLGIYIAVVVINVVGEEFWWRGYILPRQELALGKKTWLIHGLMWTLFHFFWWWNLIALLPVCLGIAFVASKTKSSWPGLIAHLIYNGIGIFVVASVVSGSI